MSDAVLQLYPPPSQEKALKGLYLNQDLRSAGRELERAFVYSNYVVSLDGRIAVPHPEKEGMVVPDQIANDRDWRLFQELAVQADVLITSGRYLRDYADGRAQEILRVYDDPRFEDLKAWREARGLPTYPALTVISASLRFPVPEVLTAGDRRLLVITVENADTARVRDLERRNAQIFTAGEEAVEGGPLIDRLSGLGYRTVYNTTGPKVLHLLLAGDVLDRLFLTHANRILGGSPFSSIVEGQLLDPPAGFRLEALYHDPHALNGLGQQFCAFRRERVGER